MSVRTDGSRLKGPVIKGQSVVTKLEQSPGLSKHLKLSTIAIALAWTVVIIIAISLELVSEYRATLELVRIEAANSFEKDLVYRRWAASHGGSMSL